MKKGGTMALREYRTSTTDNRRWQRFTHRPGDIFVCTPPKCGTTWTQTIVASLLWPEGPAPGPVMTVAPWLDAQFYPIDELLARLEAQTHRRSIKTHTPADGIPIFDDARYVFVARDGRDAFMSLCHHYEVFKSDVRQALNERAAADGVPPMPDWTGDIHGFFQRWLEDAALLHHVATFWERRERSNLLFVHFSDLKRDLAGEMRRIAGFLELDVAEARWPAVVERCTFESMRARGDEIGTFAIFEGGAKSFLFQGTSGRWRDVLSDAELEAYAKRVDEVLPPDAAEWLAQGRRGIAGARPSLER
jgi:aryl sulfotransferase